VGSCPLARQSYAVRDFYLNGGNQAIIVRLASGAQPTTLSLPTGAQAPNDALPLVAANGGTWGNNHFNSQRWVRIRRANRREALRQCIYQGCHMPNKSYRKNFFIHPR
jgi:hypothetical protein